MQRNRLAQRIHDVPPSGIRRFFDIAAQMHDVVSLGIGEPDFVTPDHIRQAAIDSIQAGKTAYTSNSGLLELRVAIADSIYAQTGIRYDPEEEILVTVGVSEAMQQTMLALINPGDEVIVPEPCFVAYTACVIFAGGVPVTVSTTVANDFAVDPAAIAAAITPRTKAILIGYPNNPTGAVIDAATMQAIVDLAVAHNLTLISDEIYDRLVYGVPHVSAVTAQGARDCTVLMGGFSKAYAMTGWRLGWLAAPADICGAVRKIHQYGIMSAPTAAQYAGLEALRHGAAATQMMVAEYDCRRQVLLAGLRRIGLPTFEARGAFYLFPQVDHLGLSSADFCERLLNEEHVAVIPGDVFGPSGAGFVRLCYAASMHNIEIALERIERFIRRVV
jgi:aminotransferase